MPSSLTIPLTGLGANYPVPGAYTEISFAQGAASLGTGTYAVLFIANKSTAGDATTNTVVYGGPNSPLPFQTLTDVANRSGIGSEMYRGIKRFLSVNTTTPFYGVFPTESGGTAATLVITFTTTAAANGNVRLYVGDDYVDTTITSGDTVTTIAGNVKNSVNSKLEWAVTANNVAGVLTLTAKNIGPRGNWLRGSAVITGSGVSTTSNVTAQTFFTGGATADSNSTALTTILPNRYYYIVSAAEDATQFGAVVTQVTSQALPTTGIRQRAFCGSVDTLSNVTTIATGLNNARAEVVWGQNLDVTPFELACLAVGIYAREEAPLSFRCNFSGYGNSANDTWPLKAPKSGTSPTVANITSALNNGITPIGVTATGTTYLVKRITTKSQTSSNADYRIRDAHKVTICDRFADDLIAKFTLNFQGKKIADDPAAGQRLPGPTIVTPSVAKAAVWKLLDDYDALDLLQNVATIKANTLVIREASPTTRLSMRVPLQPIDILDQVASAIDQVA